MFTRLYWVFLICARPRLSWQEWMLLYYLCQLSAGLCRPAGTKKHKEEHWAFKTRTYIFMAALILSNVIIHVRQCQNIILLFDAKSSSFQKPLADWVVPLSGMKMLSAVPPDCEMGYHSRVFFGSHKVGPFGKFMGQQTPQLEWPLSGWDMNTDELGWHAKSVSQSLLVCSHLTFRNCVPLTANCHVWHAPSPFLYCSIHQHSHT